VSLIWCGIWLTDLAGAALWKPCFDTHLPASSKEAFVRNKNMGRVAFPIGVVLIIVTMVLPLPDMLIDLFVAVNIATAILVLLVSMNVRRALEFAAFPSLLLVLTMARLALNVSTTRAILSRGEAGGIIETFGSVVVAGNLVVGLVVFLIITVVQFVVVAQGSGRVAEVSARFTLDAMPGKQMAIDADLAAGALSEEEARTRRKEISDESDFYGAMDGASKFVKGDAIAGIVIVIVNLIGGFVIGVAQNGLTLGESITKYSLLSVGDGLVSQIPALLLSVASGLIVTRSAGEGDLGSDVMRQFKAQWKTLATAGWVVMGLGLVPGMPKFPFFAIGLVMVLAGRRAGAALRADAVESAVETEITHLDPNDAVNLTMESRVEALEVDLAIDLVELADSSVGGDLLDRMSGLRRKIALELGFVLPAIRTRDDANLPANTYVIRVHDVEVGRGVVPPGRVLVIADDYTGLPGDDVVEPVFNLPARWVPSEFRAQAESIGATVVDRSSLIVTHLSEVVRRRAGKLLSRSDVRALVESVKQTDPTVTDELAAAGITMGDVQRILSALLEEGIPVRDLVRILEVVSERGRHTKATEPLVEAVRAELGPSISTMYAKNGVLRAVTLDAVLETSLAEHLKISENGSFLDLDQVAAANLEASIAREISASSERQGNPVLVCSGLLRPALSRYIRQNVPGVPVLAYHELGDHLSTDVVGVARP
jgi:flagellar biosynthesis protein FlhA